MKNKVALALTQSSIRLALFRGENLVKSEKIQLREISIETIQERISSITGVNKISDRLLILPRTEVLERELAVTVKSGLDRKAALRGKLEEVLPFSPKEMAYGMSLEQNEEEVRGQVLALPEKRLRESLLFLERVGFVPTEIVTEEQPLLWLLLERKEDAPLLLLDQDDERFLALFVQGGKILLTRIVSGNLTGNAITDFLTELSLLLMERGRKAEKIILSGEWDDETRARIIQHFACPVGYLNQPALSGACLYQKYPRVSLLPQEEKVKASVRARKNLIRETVLISLVFVGSLSLAFSSHWQALKWREEKINREIQKLSPMVDEVKRIISTLQLIEELKLSKIGILQFLKEISTKVPSSIVFRQIKMEKDEFIFKGESPSHGEISDVVENLQEIPFIRDVKLEHTRLRKRLNLDYFEFEVGGFIRANSKLHRRLEERASQSKNEVLASMWELIARKADYEKEWGKFKDRMEKPHDQWTKTFLDYSQKESVLFEKIEPESESRLYLLFGGDITQLLRFFYYLLEKEPLTQIESFSIRQDDEIKGLIYEITLAKNAP